MQPQYKSVPLGGVIGTTSGTPAKVIAGPAPTATIQAGIAGTARVVQPTSTTISTGSVISPSTTLASAPRVVTATPAVSSVGTTSLQASAGGAPVVRRVAAQPVSPSTTFTAAASTAPTSAPSGVIKVSGGAPIVRPAVSASQLTTNALSSTVRTVPITPSVAPASNVAVTNKVAAPSAVTTRPLTASVAPTTATATLASGPVVRKVAAAPLQPSRIVPSTAPVAVTAVAAAVPSDLPSNSVTELPSNSVTDLPSNSVTDLPSNSVTSVTMMTTVSGPGPTSSMGAGPVIPETAPHPAAGPGLTQGAYEQKHQDDPKLQNLREIRKTSGLKEVPVGHGLKTLKLYSQDDKLTRDDFLAGYDELLKTHGVETPTIEVKNAVFDLFDRDDNNVVDMMELICGISLLCSGTEEEKIHAIFEVFDENGDNYISMDEMFKFLTSVFNVVLTPQVIGVMNSMGVRVNSAEDLASVTALECFKQADLNKDGKLSVTEFKQWFYTPRNDPSFLFSPVKKLLQ